MEIVALVAVFIVVTVLAVLLAVYSARLKYENRFRQWQVAETQRREMEKTRAVREAIQQSRVVLGGKFTEQMTPYLPQFNYDPTEARFIGNPIDFIVFPGLSRGEPEEIVIMEVKSGRTGQLTGAQRKIRQLIEDGMVRWELLQKPPGPGEPG